MPDVAILGSGAVGALLGAALTRGGVATTLVTRESSAELLSRVGLRVQSPRFGDHHVAIRAQAALDDPVDVLLVAVKAPHLEAALRRVRAQPRAIVPLLNGVEHLAVLRERFGDRVVAGTVRVQAHRDGPAHVVHRAPFVTVTVAQPGVPALTTALAAADVDLVAGGSDAEVLWGKLTRLAGLALATTAADAPLGEVRAEAEHVSGEVVAVARAEGVDLHPAALVAELRGLPDTATSSLRADVTAGVADHELDAIGGAVLRAAARHGVAVDLTATLVDAVAARARRR